MNDINKQIDKGFITNLNELYDGVILCDTHGIVNFLNPNFENKFGWKNEEITNKKFSDNVFPNDREIFQENFNFILNQSNQTIKCQIHFKYQDKNYRKIQLTLKNLNQNNNGILICLNNISDNKSNIETTEERFKIFQKVSEYTTGAISIYKVVPKKDELPQKYQFITANKAFEKLVGLKENELSGKYLRQAFPDTEKIWFDSMDEVYISGTPKKIEHFSQELNKYIETTIISPIPNTIALIGNDITHRKQIEEALYENEKRGRLFIENTPLPIAMFDTNMCYLAASKRWYKDYKLPPDNIIGKSHYEVFPEIPDRWKDDHQRVLNGEIYKNEADKFIRQDGSIQYLRYELHPWRKSNNDIGGIIMFTQDITESIYTKQELIESEQRLKTLQNASFGGIAIHHNGTLLDCNKGLSEISGYSYDELVGMNIIKLITPECHDFVLGKMNIGYEFPYETVGLKKNGEEYPLRIKGRNTPYKGKKVRSVELTDITEQKETEQQLIDAKEKAEKNELIIERQLAAITKSEKEIKKSRKEIIVKNEISNAFILSNDAELYKAVLDIVQNTFKCKFGLFGYIDSSKEEKLICPSMTFDIWDKCAMKNKTIEFSKSEWSGLWGEALIKKETLYKNSNLYFPNGHVKLTNALAAPILHKEKVIGIVVIANIDNDFNHDHKKLLTDICAYISPLLNNKLIEEKYKKELIKAKEKAERANKLKTEFLNNISHEVRTPMNGIIGFAELLDNSKITEESRQYYTKIIKNSGFQLLKIIDDILEISSIETNQQRINKELFSANELLDELLSVYNLQSKENNIPIHVKNNTEDNEIFITSDKAKLNRILGNLIENALKFTLEGFIEVGYTLQPSKITFYVKDTGIGISAENHKMIFEKFSQENKDLSRTYGGLGLGLSISKVNAELLGGSINIESEKGKGSTFYISIPYKKEKTLHKDFKNFKKQKITETQALLILVAEDEDINYLYIETLLENEGNVKHKVLRAKNGKEAIEICNKNTNIDLILMDIKMPEMGGLDAAQIIKASFPDLPIIAQTAYASKQDKKLALRNGCDDYISKPIDRENLFLLINKHTKKIIH